MERSGKGFSALLIFLILYSCVPGSGDSHRGSNILRYQNVKDKIKKIQPEIELCYLSTIKSRKIFYGKLLLTLEIDRKGVVRRLIWKPIPPKIFRECAEEVIRNMKFGSLPDTLRVEIPLKFSLEMEDKK